MCGGLGLYSGALNQKRVLAHIPRENLIHWFDSLKKTNMTPLKYWARCRARVEFAEWREVDANEQTEAKLLTLKEY